MSAPDYARVAAVVRALESRGGPVNEIEAAIAKESAAKLCEAMPAIEELLAAAESLGASQAYDEWRDSAHVVMVKVDTLLCTAKRVREALKP